MNRTEWARKPLDGRAVGPAAAKRFVGETLIADGVATWIAEHGALEQRPLVLPMRGMVTWTARCSSHSGVRIPPRPDLCDVVEA